MDIIILLITTAGTVLLSTIFIDQETESMKFKNNNNHSITLYMLNWSARLEMINLPCVYEMRKYFLYELLFKTKKIIILIIFIVINYKF